MGGYNDAMSNSTGSRAAPTSQCEAARFHDQRIVFFDGVCGLCNHTVNFFLRHDVHGRLKFAPLQGRTAEAVVPSAFRDRLDTMMYSREGQLLCRSAAMVRILRDLGGVWRLLGAVLWIIPAPFRDLGYRCVAAMRYRLFGRHETCRIPTPEERVRFLD